MTFHYLARGVIRLQGRILLVHECGAANTFLPGGHIHVGESAEEALSRELLEEIGVETTVAGFLGAIEHVWPDSQPDNHEINLVFALSAPQLDADIPPPSLEPHIEFLWAEESDLAAYDLRPQPMRQLIAGIAAGCRGYWGSTIERRRAHQSAPTDGQSTARLVRG